MRIPSHRLTSGVGINMTPMIDVVFQLIIFFLVASHLARQEAQLELPLPVADSGDLATEDRPSVVVNVLQSGDVLLGGRAVAPAQLEQQLGRLLQDETDMEIRIRADRRVAYRFVQPVMLACYRLGVKQVTYSVYRSQDVR